jgi:hypothetical protein
MTNRKAPSFRWGNSQSGRSRCGIDAPQFEPFPVISSPVYPTLALTTPMMIMGSGETEIKESSLVGSIRALWAWACQ